MRTLSLVDISVNDRRTGTQAHFLVRLIAWTVEIFGMHKYQASDGLYITLSNVTLENRPYVYGLIIGQQIESAVQDVIIS